MSQSVSQCSNNAQCLPNSSIDANPSHPHHTIACCRVTLRKEDTDLLRSELHPNATLTSGPDIAPGTQARPPLRPSVQSLRWMMGPKGGYSNRPSNQRGGGRDDGGAWGILKSKSTHHHLSHRYGSTQHTHTDTAPHRQLPRPPRPRGRRPTVAASRPLSLCRRPAPHACVRNDPFCFVPFRFYSVRFGKGGPTRPDQRSTAPVIYAIANASQKQHQHTQSSSCPPPISHTTPNHSRIPFHHQSPTPHHATPHHTNTPQSNSCPPRSRTAPSTTCTTTRPPRPRWAWPCCSRRPSACCRRTGGWVLWCVGRGKRQVADQRYPRFRNCNI